MKYLALLLSAFFLTACPGGGSGDGSTVAASDTNPDRPQDELPEVPQNPEPEETESCDSEDETCPEDLAEEPEPEAEPEPELPDPNTTLTGATNLILAPESDGIPAAFDDDSEIYYAWNEGSDDVYGIDRYTVVRYLSADCSGLSHGVWSTTATSIAIVGGGDNESISFKVQTFNNAGAMVTSECSSSITIDKTAPTGNIIIDGGNSYTGTSDVELTLSANDTGVGSVESMYITRNFDCETGGVWESYTSTVSKTLPSPGTNRYYVKFRDTAGNESECYNDFITWDAYGPNTISITIKDRLNSSTVVTKHDLVRLELSAYDQYSDVEEMYVTNTNGCGSGGVWVDYGTSKYWTLGTLNATSTVYVKFRDSFGNESACISDSILHDSLPPTSASVVINDENGDAADTVYSDEVSISIDANDVHDLYVTNNADCSTGGNYWQNWQTDASDTGVPTMTLSWTLGDSRPATVYVNLRDELGNETCVSDSIQVIKWRSTVLVDAGHPEGGGAYYKIEEPKLVSDASGNILAIWMQENASFDYDLVYSRFEGVSWSAPQVIDSGAGTIGARYWDSAFEVAMDSAGNAFLVYGQLETVAGDANNPADVDDMWATRFDVGTKTWSTPVKIEQNPKDIYKSHMRVEVDATGNALVTWMQNDENDLLTVWSNYYNGSWNGVEKVSVDGLGHIDHSSNRPTLTMDSSGNAFIMFTQADGGLGYNDTWVRRFDKASASWETPEIIHGDISGSSWAGAIAFDHEGNALAVWSQPSNNSRYSRRYIAGSGWDAEEDIVRIPAINDSLYKCEMKYDGLGNAFLAWKRDGYVDTLVYNNSTGWSDLVVLSTAYSGISYPMLDLHVEANGEAYVTWTQITYSTGEGDVNVAKYNPASGWDTENIKTFSSSGHMKSSEVTLANGVPTAIMVENKEFSGYHLHIYRYD